jgi:methionyl-tRNA formyltransferase
MKNIVFLGSKAIGYYCLEKLIHAQLDDQLHIQGVVTQHNAALAKGTDIYQLIEDYDLHVYESVDDIEECDIMYSVQYHEILKEKDLEKATLALNLHMAPLPEYRGANQFSYALLENKKEFGVTIHKMDSKIDHGPIAFEKRFPIPEMCWVNDLYTLAETAAVELFAESLPNILKNNISWTNQEDLVNERGTSLHYKKEIESLKHLDPTWPKDKIMAHVRATFMPGFEPPYFIIDDKKVYCKPQDAS